MVREDEDTVGSAARCDAVARLPPYLEEDKLDSGGRSRRRKEGKDEDKKKK